MNEEGLKNKKNISDIKNFETTNDQPKENVDLSAENRVEQKIDQPVITDQEGVKTNESANSVAVSQKTPVTTTTTEEKSELRQAVERIMEANLKDLYLTMTPAERIEFKKKGEQTAQEITLEVQQSKININKILKLLFDWLRAIPGINRFFVEQEAKLKTDQIIKMSK